MKNLIYILTVSSILSACGSGSGSSGANQKTPTEPVVNSPAQDITAVPPGTMLSNQNCLKVPYQTADGEYAKIYYIKGPNDEFDTLYEYYSKSTCLIEDLTMTQAFLNDIVSSEKINNDFVLNLKLFDVQYNIFNQDVLNFYNQGSLFETVWTLNTLTSVVGKKALPTDGGPAYIQHMPSTTAVRVHPDEKIVFINGTKFTWQ